MSIIVNKSVNIHIYCKIKQKRSHSGFYYYLYYYLLRSENCLNRNP